MESRDWVRDRYFEVDSLSEEASNALFTDMHFDGFKDLFVGFAFVVDKVYLRLL